MTSAATPSRATALHSPSVGTAVSGVSSARLSVGMAACAALKPVRASDILAQSRRREARWRPGLLAASHSEVFASAQDASGAGTALALARDALAAQARAQRSDPLAEVDDQRQILWVQDREAIRLTGRPYAQGLPPDLRRRVIHVAAKSAQDALFALEEGLRCRDLAFVMGEIAGNPRALDFTASRRLSLAAEKHGVPLWLVRLEASADLSSARMRWRVEAAPSVAPRWNADAPGDPAWQAELFRARMHPPGEWILSDEKGNLRAAEPRKHTAAADIGNLARPTVGRSLAAL